MDGFIEPSLFTPAVAAPAPARAADWLVPQRWDSYSPAEHATWLTLVDRQTERLQGRACGAFLDGLHALDLRGDGIPDFVALSDRLEALTGWRIVPVEGLVPDEVFVQLLARRQFPAGRFIRPPHQLDYIEAPDVFHDVFGHVPMLTDPAFADFMQAYGEAGVRAAETGALEPLARLYWFTVEFGLLQGPAGPSLYGAGLASSPAECVHALESSDVERRPFGLAEVTATPFRTDVMQPLYFVIESFEALLALADEGFRA
ncbi:MAG TPA: phenylalanine 4-monooxygenase [Caulobacteraceae bacterium]|jgi:phenylalanine-4-hydroxylase